MAGLFQRTIDRAGAEVPLTIDGEPVRAQMGDLLITAILLHRAALRRFEAYGASGDVLVGARETFLAFGGHLAAVAPLA